MIFLDTDRTIDRVLVVLALAGIASAAGLFVAHGVDVDGMAGFSWMAAIALLGAALAWGLRLRGRSPRSASALLAVGAAAPIVAWYHLWYWYPLGVAIFVLAVVTMPNVPRGAHRTRPHPA